MEYYKEFEKEMKTNKPIHLKPTNWEEHKETFYNQQIDTYKGEGISKDMIIEEELEILESLIFLETKHKRVKKLYTRLLNEKLKIEQSKIEQNKPEQIKKQIKLEDFFFEKHKTKAQELLTYYKNPTNKKIAFLINILHKNEIIRIERSGLSRLRFTEIILNKAIKNNEGINLYFQSFGNHELKSYDKKYDSDFQILENEIKEIFKLPN
jgi:hypothetical protein